MYVLVRKQKVRLDSFAIIAVQGGGCNGSKLDPAVLSYRDFNDPTKNSKT